MSSIHAKHTHTTWEVLWCSTRWEKGNNTSTLAHYKYNKNQTSPRCRDRCTRYCFDLSRMCPVSVQDDEADLLRKKQKICFRALPKKTHRLNQMIFLGVSSGRQNNHLVRWSHAQFSPLPVGNGLQGGRQQRFNCRARFVLHRVEVSGAVGTGRQKTLIPS